MALLFDKYITRWCLILRTILDIACYSRYIAWLSYRIDEATKIREAISSGAGYEIPSSNISNDTKFFGNGCVMTGQIVCSQVLGNQSLHNTVLERIHVGEC